MIESGTLITPDLEPLWITERNNSVGASEAAASLGISPYVSPIALWQRKLGLAPPQPVNDAMKWGKRLEGVILDAYAEQVGEAVTHRQEFLRHPDFPFMTATLDGRRSDRLVEAKSVSAYSNGWGDEGSDDVPEIYLIQVQHQLACSGADLADLVALVGGTSLRVYTIERDEELIAEIVGGVERFWDHVLRRDPPCYGPIDSKALAVLNPECCGEIDLDSEVAIHVNTYEAHSAAIKSLEDARDECKTYILEAMGRAKTGHLPDGRRVNRVLNQTPACTKTVHYAASTRHYFTLAKGKRP